MAVRMVVLLLCSFWCYRFISGKSYTGTWGKTCNIPSRFWCETKELAADCGVYQQCEENEWTEYESAPPVSFTLYYETLCPDCKYFFKEMLYPSYQKVGDIMNLTLVPYGNAREWREGDQWRFECQHGEEECQGNLIQTCTIAIVQNISVYLPFIHCMEASSASVRSAAEKCSKQYPVPLQKIMNCTRSKLGNQLEHEMALMTNALQPSHEYVPWVTLNGVHTEKIQKEAENNLVQLVCDTYRGRLPPACRETM